MQANTRRASRRAERQVPAQALRRPVLRDPELDEVLARDGWVLIPAVAPDDVAWIREMACHELGRDRTQAGYEGLGAPDPDTPWDARMMPGEEWRIGIDEQGPEHRAALEDRLQPFWAPVVEQHFHDHRYVFSSFLAKHPSETSALPLHQDPTFVDERAAASYTAWLALDEISARRDNGPMHALLGSHLVGREQRGTSLDPTYLPDMTRLWPYAERIEAQAGDLVIIDSRLVHGSPPNRSGQIRYALAAVVIPVGERLRHMMGQDDEILVLDVDDDFYLRSSPLSLIKDPPTELPVIEHLSRAEHRTTGDDLVANAEARKRRRFSWRPRKRDRATAG